MTKAEYREELLRLNQVINHYRNHLGLFYETIQYQNEILSRIKLESKNPTKL
ncbi:hypothetical protein [Oceanispirochaeta sp. M1]|uniref:hypothetical protein n=1 Tax=Oceanispirochaeta sp. M1 TaxID=2283433 RepID=UPI001314854C|nr:hypothetical protein [Oceanispirochaeta sp. M1]NPD75304.1 hypothetical protein [Oceanispirochaeta sp. M1]